MCLLKIRKDKWCANNINENKIDKTRESANLTKKCLYLTSLSKLLIICTEGWFLNLCTEFAYSRLFML